MKKYHLLLKEYNCLLRKKMAKFKKILLNIDKIILLNVEKIALLNVEKIILLNVEKKYGKI